MTDLLRTSMCLLVLTAAARVSAEVAPDPQVLAAEAERVEVIKRASRAAVAIFEASGQGGGSGVLISPPGSRLPTFTWSLLAVRP